MNPLLLWNISLLLALTLISVNTVSAAACPNSLYFFTADGVDGRLTYARSNTSSLEECVRKCFSSDFCFSAVYSPSKPANNLAAECRLSYVAALNCSSRTLTNTYATPDKPALIECIKCPALHESIPPSPSPAFVDSFANATTASPKSSTTSTIRFTSSDISNSTNVSSSTISSRSISTSSTLLGNSTSGSSSTTTTSSSIQSQSSITFTSGSPSAKSTTTIVEESTKHSTNTTNELLSSVANVTSNSTFIASSTAPTVVINSSSTVIGSSPGINGSLLEIGTKPTDIIRTSRTGLTVASVSSTTSHPISTSSKQSPSSTVSSANSSSTKLPEFRTCSNLIFEIQEIENIDAPSTKQLALEFQNVISSPNVADCALKCYERQCAHALYAQTAPNEIGRCYVNFNGTEVCAATHRLTSYNITQFTHIRIRCLTCKPSFSGQFSSAEVDIGPGSAVCRGTLSFNVLDPAPSRALAFSNHSQAESADECAKLCFERRCTIAGFAPPSDNNSKAGSCLFSYGPDHCTTGNALSHYEARGLVQIECIKCLNTTVSNVTGATTPLPLSSSVTTIDTKLSSSLISSPSPPPSSSATIVLSSSCKKLSFIPQKPDFDVSLNFTQKILSAFIEECAQLCHLANCSAAMFLPNQNSLVKGTCLFSFDSIDCSSPNDRRTSNFTEFADGIPIELHCIRCEGIAEKKGAEFLPVIQNAPVELVKTSTANVKLSSVSSGKVQTSESATRIQDSFKISRSGISSLSSSHSLSPEQSSVTTKIQPIAANVSDFKELFAIGDRLCSGLLTYQTKVPNPDRAYSHSAFLNSTDVNECTRLCYEKTCSVASYVKGVLPGEPDTCLLNFDEEQCDNAEQRISNYTGRFPVELHCIKCDSIDNTNFERILRSSNCKRLTYERRDPTPEVYASLSQEILLNNTDHCAQLCYVANCTTAIFSPVLSADTLTTTRHGFCFLSFDNDHCSNNRSFAPLIANETSPVSLHCLKCESYSVAMETVTELLPLITNQSPATNIKHPTPTPSIMCTEINFHPRDPSFDYPLNFTHYIKSQNAHECAQMCYLVNCTTAAFLPRKGNSSQGVCHFSFDDENCTSSIVDNSSIDWNDYVQPVPVVMHCVQCDTILRSNVSISSASLLPKSTLQREFRILVNEPEPFSITSSCKKFSFEPMDPSSDTSINFTQEIETYSADDCARLCYLSKCVTVGYLPNEDPTILRGICFLSFEPEPCPLTAKRISTYPKREPIVLRCVTCDDSQADVDAVKMTFHKKTKCKFLSYLPADVDYKDKIYNFTHRLTSTSVKQCMELCYMSNCTIVAYAVNHKANKKLEGVCHLSYDYDSCDTKAPRVYNFTEDFETSSIVVMRCLRCESETEVIGTIVSHRTTTATSFRLNSISKSFSSELITRTNFGAVSLCRELTFEPRIPTVDFALTFAKDMLRSKSPEECAHQCYINKCIFVGFVPLSGGAKSRQGTCYFYFEQENCTVTRFRVSSVAADKPISLHCIKCEDSKLVDGGSSEKRSLTSSETADKHRQEIRDDNQLEAKFQTLPNPRLNTNTSCKNLTFELRNPESDLNVNFTKDFPSNGPDECAQRCYKENCVTAGFIPDDEPQQNNLGTCFLSFEDEVCHLASPNRLSSVGKLIYIVMHCVFCESNEVAKLNASALIKASSVTKTCSQLSFEPGIVYENSWNFTQQVEVLSADDCALMCYSFHCTVAAFILNTEALAKVVANLSVSSQNDRGGTCFLSYDHQDCSRNGTRVRNYIGSYPVAIRCIRCEDSVIGNVSLLLEKENHTVSTRTPLNATEIRNSSIASTVSTSHSNISSTSTTLIPALQKNYIPVQTCKSEIMFEISHLDVGIVKFTTNTSVESVEKCAQECYERNCSLARYFLENPLGSSINCFLSFEPQICTGSPQASTLLDTAPVMLQCFKCSDTVVTESNKLVPAAVIKAAPVTIEKPGAILSSVSVSTRLTSLPVTSGQSSLTTKSSLPSSITTLHPSPASQSSTPTTAVFDITPKLLDFNLTTNVSSQDNNISSPSPLSVLTKELQSSRKTPGIPIFSETTKEVTATSSSSEVSPLTADGFFLLGNCTVVFEVSDLDSNNKINWVNRTVGFSLTECAAQCYLDGCNAVGYVPEEGKEKDICLFSFGRDHCLGTDKVSYVPESNISSLLLQCIRCADGINLLTPPPRNLTLLASASIIGEPKTTVISGKLIVNESTVEFKNHSDSNATLPTLTIDQKSRVSTSKALELSPLSSPIHVTAQSVAPVLNHSISNFSSSLDGSTRLAVVNAVQTTNVKPVTIPIPSGGVVSAVVSGNKISSDESNRISPPIVRTCWGLLKFSTEPVENDDDAADYTYTTAADTIEECAVFCYRRACSAAQFIPISDSKNIVGRCHLRFTDVSCPTNEQQQNIVKNSVKQPVLLRCFTCVRPTATAKAISSSAETLPNNDKRDHALEIPSRTKCYNQITFQVHPPISSLSVKFSSDIFVNTSTECAKTCYNRNCEIAGYIPSSITDATGGVCLLSETKGMCYAEKPKIIDEPKNSPFILDCIECSPCNFTVKVLDRELLPLFEERTSASSISECAEKCYRKRCTSSAYFSQKLVEGNCFLTTKLTENCRQSTQRRVEWTDKTPVLLDCIRCELISLII